MSIFSGLEVANRGLSAAQLAINVAGQNITNASDPTYSRKRIEQQAEWLRSASYGQIGYGVEVYSINRVRDQFIDRLVNEETTRHGFYGIKSEAFGRIESIFGEPSDTTLNTLLNNFWNGWMEVANDPTKAGPREALRSTSQSLVTQFHYLSTQLRSYKDTINDEIEARVNRINEITEGINRCNMVITTTETSPGKKANDSRDQRDALLEELAQMIDIEYFEGERGAVVVTTNGNMIVSEAKAHKLAMKSTEVTAKDGYQHSRIDISFAQTGAPYIPKGGELRALMDIRDIEIPKYEDYLNELSTTLVTEVNKLHQNGYSLSGLTFMDFFDGDPNKAYAANISLSPAILRDVNNIAAATGGQKSTVTNGFTSAVSGQYTVNTTADPTVPLSNFFPPHLASQPSSGANSIIDWSSLIIRDTSNPDPTTNMLQIGVDYNISPITGEIIFDPSVDGTNVSIDFNTTLPKYTVPLLTAPNPGVIPPPNLHTLDLPSFDPTYRFIYQNSLTMDVRDANGNVVQTLQEGKDYDIDYTTAQITFKYSATNAFGPENPLYSPPGLEITITFDYHKSGFSGHGDGDNAMAISQIKDKTLMQSDVFGRNTQTINEFYAGMLGRLGTERNEADAGLETRVAALQQLKIQQQAIMGVNLDEEMSSLIKYEHTYQASARYLTTLNSMLDTLLNM